MRFILKQKWLVLIAWIAVVAVLMFSAPNMAELVREKGQVDVPEGYSSSLASDIMSEVQEQEGGGDESSVALVFTDEKGLSAADKKEIERAIRQLEKNKEELGITEILTHFNEKSLEKQLVSKDGNSILTSIKVAWNDREPSEVNEALYKTIEDNKVDHYYTSNWMINEDLVKSSEEGLKKTEGITVVFILGVLLLVFRSVVAPLIPLLTVGVTYLASQSIVAMLVDSFDFPISNYTQIFLVAVLFGIGTDYCILLLSRYKEELTLTESKTEAIIATYRQAGRTVFFSGLAVMIGFAAIGFSQFILYQSAAAVAVGVGILLVALFTIVPFFMMVLGQKIFWPSKKKAEHGESKLWAIAGNFSLKRPLLSLILVAIICVPFLVTYDGKLSFNSLEEISGDVSSIQAFNVIEKSFGAGESMPTNIVIKNDEKMDSTSYMELAEKISQELEKVNHVDAVRSVSRPTGEPVEDFFVYKQAENLGDGLGDGKEGINKISSGLMEASGELSKSEPQLTSATDGIQQLIDGTSATQSGLTEIQKNLVKIEDGIRKGTMGAADAQKGLQQIKSKQQELLSGYQKIQQGYEQAGSNLSTIQSNYVKLEQGLGSLNTALASIKDQDFQALENRYGIADDDAEYQKIKNTVKATQNQLPVIKGQLDQLNSGLNQVSSGVQQANGKFKEINGYQQGIIGGLQQVIDGTNQLQSGLGQLADGQGQIVDNVPKLTNGLNGINNGQQELLKGFEDLGGQFSQLTTGLDQSADGLNQVSDGLGSAQNYLNNLAETKDKSAFYMPEEVLQSKDFEQALDAYLSKDRKTMTMDVVFGINPYSNESIDEVDEIKDAINRVTKGTELENAKVAVGGITSSNADLQTVSSNDFSRTVLLMLVGISIILVFLFRSLIMPVYLIGSLILTYYTSMGINEFIYVNLLGYTGISWAVPFFGFVILVALGVDYSIFLMDRFNEYKDLTVADAMLLAMKKMGTVIISAVIILGGTFAAMMPSGMLSLLQIASIILVGLLLYAFVVLPLLIPVLVKNFGEANWWPYKRS
ncbi:MMPL family transporter [Fictibacillus phosphorivorans]|uniref:MMPL family transporter n=1 Tax=Fictibacillus phosphorivorans TaxID=1221500 RepID=UPI0012CBE189|nr:MMPL family transporter [Fictibacillus phosphorivorans]MQR95002.1 MMPL family transporter [Fictibacillus phosphorivorans]